MGELINYDLYNILFNQAAQPQQNEFVCVAQWHQYSSSFFSAFRKNISFILLIMNTTFLLSKLLLETGIAISAYSFESLHLIIYSIILFKYRYVCMFKFFNKYFFRTIHYYYIWEFYILFWSSWFHIKFN